MEIRDRLSLISSFEAVIDYIKKLEGARPTLLVRIQLAALIAQLEIYRDVEIAHLDGLYSNLTDD